ncbi:MAG: BrnA antitoxin family protein [Acidobacteriota bacterium]|nr:MAG: BrnA antitoxin family protein [Acidobacteriota bacterium]
MKKEYDFSQGKREAVVKPVAGKTRITIRIDDEILQWFKGQAHLAEGANYQTMINDALKSFIIEKKEPLEKVLRRVVREELKRIA